MRLPSNEPLDSNQIIYYKGETNMTRFKQELRKAGYKLEIDYPWLPYDVGGGVSIESVHARIEDNAIVLYKWYNVVGWTKTVLDRHMNEIGTYNEWEWDDEE